MMQTIYYDLRDIKGQQKEIPGSFCLFTSFFRKKILLSSLNQFSVFYQMTQQQRALLGADSEELRNVLAVGKARLREIGTDRLPVALRGDGH